MSNEKKSHNRSEHSDFEEKVLFVNRCSKAVKGGRSFSFSALVSIGDTQGTLGVGFGKASDVSDAIRKGTEAAKKNARKYTISPVSVSYEVLGEADSASVLIRPAPEGKGVIAGSHVRVILELLGVKNVVAKVIRKGSAQNIVRATLRALEQLNEKGESQ